MIVHPDFLDHWKTRKLTELTKDECAPMMLLRLWGYCQKNKAWVFQREQIDLAFICHSRLPGTEVERLLTECRFVRVTENELTVHDWEKSNRIYRNSWENGSKGGRYVKGFRKPVANPRETHRQPTGSYVQKNRIDKAGSMEPIKKSEEEHKPISEEQRLANIKKFGEQVGSITDVLKGKISETGIIR
jgi:hypothetical protein